MHRLRLIGQSQWIDFLSSKWPFPHLKESNGMKFMLQTTAHETVSNLVLDEKLMFEKIIIKTADSSAIRDALF